MSVTRDSIESAREQFAAEVVEHRMTVLHDDGLYRHLRFAKPGTGMWSWSLVTWPGHLAVSGDIGDGWVFEREDDMLQFFGRNGHQSGINPSYWAEKLPSHMRVAAKHFSADRFEAAVRADVESRDLTDEQKSLLLESLELSVFQGYDDLGWSLSAIAGTWMPAGVPVEFEDFEHGEYDDWEHHFLLALFAIVHGVRQYREYEAAIEAARASAAP